MQQKAERRCWFFIDQEGAALRLVLDSCGEPAAARRAMLHSRAEGRYLRSAVISAAGHGELRLAVGENLGSLSVKAQELRDGTWEDITALEPVVIGDEWEVVDLDARVWGVDRDCVMTIAEPITRRRQLSVSLDATNGWRQPAIVRFPFGAKLELDVRAVGEARTRGPRLIEQIQLVPSTQRARTSALPLHGAGALKWTRRQNVVVAPLQLKPAGRGGIATHGLLGAWDDEGPISEAMDFVLGRQRYQYQTRPVAPAAHHRGPVIYAGSPHGSWGHFLTQGLARLWFACENPDLPILWDGRALQGYMRTALTELGIANEHVFIDRPMRFDEMIFPYPGVCIGDLVEPEWARAIGRVPVSPTEPGKKLFLTRSRLASGRGSLSGDADSTLDGLFEDAGFTLFAPETVPMREQLHELSSAEVVAGIEGSSFHTLLLLQGTPATRYFALTRHRGGAGVFEHIKRAKQLRYETLNFLATSGAVAHGAVDIDLPSLGRALRDTRGLTENLGVMEPRMERPAAWQTSFESHLQNTQIRPSLAEQDLLNAMEALRRRDIATAERLIGGLF